MTTEEAVYVIAHMEGIDLSKDLSLAELDRVRALVPRQATAGIRRIRQPKPVTRKKRNASSKYPLVEDELVKVADRLGSEVFPLVFVLESSIRALIKKRLSKNSKDWWEKFVPKEVKDNVNRTMNRENRYPYREQRGDEPLYYANFSDLKKIISENNLAFADVIIDFEWFRVRMDEVYMARNNLAHSVPLSPDDVSRISLFNRDWARLLKTALDAKKVT
ncbi:MAG: hypothetical protein B6D41_18585 [Chloroflexi bacterium UTCFX4]|nr:MAG: hypothetical protein B6D41_18585 [Chloroflexi bacterium UTCFX4]